MPYIYIKQIKNKNFAFNVYAMVLYYYLKKTQDFEALSGLHQNVLLDLVEKIFFYDKVDRIDPIETLTVLHKKFDLLTLKEIFEVFQERVAPALKEKILDSFKENKNRFLFNSIECELMAYLRNPNEARESDFFSHLFRNHEFEKINKNRIGCYKKNTFFSNKEEKDESFKDIRLCLEKWWNNQQGLNIFFGEMDKPDFYRDKIIMAELGRMYGIYVCYKNKNLNDKAASTERFQEDISAIVLSYEKSQYCWTCEAEKDDESVFLIEERYEGEMLPDRNVKDIQSEEEVENISFNKEKKVDKAVNSAHSPLQVVTGQILTRKKRRLWDKFLGISSFIVDLFNSGSLMGVLSLISDLKRILSRAVQEKIDVARTVTGFSLRAIDWGLSLLRYVFSNNKNLGQSSELMLKTVTGILVGFAIFGVAVVGATAPFLIIAAISLEVAFFLGLTIYHGVRALRESKKMPEKAYYATQAKMAVSNVILGLLFLATVVLSVMNAPALAIIVMVSSAIFAAVLFLSLRIYFSRAKQSSKNNQKFEEITDAIAIKPNHKKTDEANLKKRRLEKNRDYHHESTPLMIKATDQAAYKNKRNVSFSGGWDIFSRYHKNAIHLTRMIASTENHLALAYNDLMRKIKKRSFALSQLLRQPLSPVASLWSQCGKWQNKKTALQDLFLLMKNVEVVLSALRKKAQSIVIPGAFNNNKFYFNHVEELCSQINHYVSTAYPAVYQSFFREIGDVEFLFERAFQILISATKVKNENLGHYLKIFKKENVDDLLKAEGNPLP